MTSFDSDLYVSGDNIFWCLQNSLGGIEVCFTTGGAIYIISLIANKKRLCCNVEFQKLFSALEDSLEICRGKRWTKDGWHKDQSRDWRLSQAWPTIRGCPICHVIYFSPMFVQSLQNTVFLLLIFFEVGSRVRTFLPPPKSSISGGE